MSEAQETLESLEAELKSVEATHRAYVELREKLFDASPEGMLILDDAGQMTLNESARAMLGASSSDQRWRDEWTFTDLEGSPIETQVLPCFRARSGEVPPELVLRPSHAEAPKDVVLAMESRPHGEGRSLSVLRDVTNRQRLHEELEARVEELSQQQADNAKLVERLQAAIDQIANPVLSVSDDVVVMPIIGVFDASRSNRAAEQLLKEVEEKRAGWVILDITDVETMDTTTTELFSRVMGAVRLLGSRALVSGVSPAVARSLAEMAHDSRDLPTYGTLREALKVALGEIEGKRGPRAAARAGEAPR